MAYVYIAGPYSNGDQILNVRNAIYAADVIADNGHVPFIPHLTHFWHFQYPHSYEFWMAQDRAWFEKCDCVLRLPGISAGADREVKLAFQLGIPVFYEIEDVLDWALRISNP